MVKDNSTVEQTKSKIVTSDEVENEAHRERPNSGSIHNIEDDTDHGQGHGHAHGHNRHGHGHENGPPNECVSILNGQEPVESICTGSTVIPEFVGTSRKRKHEHGSIQNLEDDTNCETGELENGPSEECASVLNGQEPEQNTYTGNTIELEFMSTSTNRKHNETLNEVTKTDADPSVSNATPITEEYNNEDQDNIAAKKKKNRCAICRKKIGLTGFTCRCGGLFCGVHRYSDKHDCTFNYRELGAQEIRRNNPVVIAEKIRKF